VTRQYLESFTFHVTDAASGERALDVCRASAREGGHFDLVVIDWEMPDLDGLETARRIAELSGGLDGPRILLVSMHGHAWSLPDNPSVSALLTKPFTPSRLFNAVASMFARPGSASVAARGQRLERRKLAGAQLLLVEDNEINQLVARQILESAGALVTIAGDGAEAVALIRGRSFDGVLMDIHMPVMDGYSAAREIRRDHPAHRLPIIAMTANAMSGDREKSLAAGMNDHVTKPVDPDEMFGTLARWIVASNPTELPPPSAESPIVESPIPQIRGVAVAEAVQRLDGDVDDYLKVVDRFRRSYRGVVVEIRLALVGGRRQEAERLAHTLNGLAGTLGATSLRSKMRDLEGAIRKGLGQDGLAALLDSADAELTALHAAVEQALPLPTAGESSIAPAAAAGALRLQELGKSALAQLAACDSSAEEAVAQLLAQAFGDAAVAPLVVQIEAHMDRYDYEAAHRDLLELVGHLDGAGKGARA
jgi:CheY-like chemotaxis protein